MVAVAEARIFRCLRWARAAPCGGSRATSVSLPIGRNHGGAAHPRGARARPLSLPYRTATTAGPHLGCPLVATNEIVAETAVETAISLVSAHGRPCSRTRRERQRVLRAQPVAE